jgi:hypothetical protein
MAFVRRKVKTFNWPVSVEEPADGGTFTESTFTAMFKRVERSALKALADKPDNDLIKAVLVGWDDMKDEAGKPLPFSDANLTDACEDSDWVRAVINAYNKTYEGKADKAREGN